MSDLQNAERLILLLHECVACPDAPQVHFCSLLTHENTFSVFFKDQLGSSPNKFAHCHLYTTYIILYILTNLLIVTCCLQRMMRVDYATGEKERSASRSIDFSIRIISITWRFVTTIRLANLEATFKLFIGNLPPDPSVELLQQMFAGRDAQEFIPIKNKPGMPNLKGSAFVKMGR